MTLSSFRDECLANLDLTRLSLLAARDGDVQNAILTLQRKPRHERPQPRVLRSAKFAAGDALKYEVIRNSPNAFGLNVTHCRYAEFYKKIGAPELGFLLTRREPLRFSVCPAP